MTRFHCHTVIVGAGIMGLTIARELISVGCEDVLILEKENTIGLHASGRNSGVLHSGIYYPSDSLKAKYCLQGNRMMRAYCVENNLPITASNKVIVASEEQELETLQLLYQRGCENGVDVACIDEHQLASIEPWAKTVDQALYVKDTAVVDPKCILQHLYQTLLKTQKVQFLFNAKFIAPTGKNKIRTTQGDITYLYFINAAGAYADQVAHTFNCAKNLSMLPFKGIYRKLSAEEAYRLNGNIYPVPNLNNPFLGVHFTKNIHGDVYVGPTAIPAFGRENYGVIKGIDSEILAISKKSMGLFLSNKNFRSVVLAEPKKYFAKCFYNSAKKIVNTLSPSWLRHSTKVGIRPQLINWQTKALVMDFCIEKNDNALHILNAISPAFTSSMAMAREIVQKEIVTLHMVTS